MAGKTLGTMLPALYERSVLTDTVRRISMVPRAEIAMIIMQMCPEVGEWAVPPSLFGAVVFVSGATNLFMPLLLRPYSSTG